MVDSLRMIEGHAVVLLVVPDAVLMREGSHGLGQELLRKDLVINYLQHRVAFVDSQMHALVRENMTLAEYFAH